MARYRYSYGGLHDTDTVATDMETGLSYRVYLETDGAIRLIAWMPNNGRIYHQSKRLQPTSPLRDEMIAAVKARPPVIRRRPRDADFDPTDAPAIIEYEV